MVYGRQDGIMVELLEEHPLNKVTVRTGQDMEIYAAGSFISNQREIAQSDDSDMFVAFFGSDIAENSPVPASFLQIHSFH